MNLSEKKVLIVEDIRSIREAIADSLSERYQIFSAAGYSEAVSILKKENIDLVISDIKMQGKTGLDLIQWIFKNKPQIQYALMTAYNINDYINFAREYNVWNIIPKYSFLDMKFIDTMVYKLLSNDIFGVEKYFSSPFEIIDSSDSDSFIDPPARGVVYKKVRSDRERNILCGKISKYFKNNGGPNSISQVLEELTSNAMIRAPRDENGNYKYQLEIPSQDLVISFDHINLSEEDAFTVGYGNFDETIILVVKDNFGSLKKEEILRRLSRHIGIDPTTGLPPGLSDSHGRGLYICREISDQLIFNIEHNHSTEAISLIERDRASGFKSLAIYEI
jgi:CheY-like chemotaxis protein